MYNIQVGWGMKVIITKSNTSFVHVGEVTEVILINGEPDSMWSEYCQRYEDVNWCKGFWGVEYEVLK